MKYGIEDRPGPAASLLYGLQWWIVTFVSIIVIGIVVARLHFGTDSAAQMLYMQKLFVLTGLSLIMQILFGHKLPVVTGPASVLMIGILISLNAGIGAIYTAIAVGGIFMTAIACSGLLKYAQIIFTTRVIVVIILLIPVTIMPVIVRLIFNGSDPAFNFIFSLVFLIILIIANRLLRGIWKSTTMVWGILLGTLIFKYLRGIAPSELTMKPAELSLLGTFDFNPGVILAFLFCAIALTVNELGSIQSVGQMLNAPDMVKRSGRGVLITGLSNIISGFMGVIGSVDYSTSPGIIASTGCASRYPFIITSVLLISGALFPSFIAILLLIPEVIMGIILLYIMVSQMAAGLQMVNQRSASADFNDAVVIALPLLGALFISLAPAEVSELLPEILRPILTNGFVMGIIFVLLMEHLIMRKKVNLKNLIKD